MTLSGVVSIAGGTASTAADVDDSLGSQSSYDAEALSGCTQSACGGWGALEDSDDEDTEGGVSERPYVKKLSVVNGDAETLVVDNTADEVGGDPEDQSGNDLVTSIVPVNLCSPSQSPSTDPNNPTCYTTPNRVSVNIGFQATDLSNHSNFDDVGAPPVINEDTEVHLTLALNSLGRSLRWTWIYGTPTFWKVTNIGQDDATIEVHFKPGLNPQVSGGGGCSQIPVMDSCDHAEADDEFLQVSLLLSLDTTLDPIFTGALFAGSRAYIGSLEAVSPTAAESGGTQTPTLTYGIAAPATVVGVANTPEFRAFLSDEAILNYFGATVDVASAPGFFASAFSVTRGGEPAPLTPTRWVAADNGSNGWLFTFDGVTVSPASLSQSGLHKQASVKSPKFVVRAKAPRPTVTFAKTGSGKSTVTKVSVAGSFKACKNKICRVVVKEITSKVRIATTKVGKPTVLRNSAGKVSGTVTAKKGAVVKGNRLSLVIQVKQKGGKWKYVTSLVRRVS